MLAGGAQLSRQLGGEQVGLGLQVELAFAVDDDLLDERAVPGGFLDGGDVDAALAVVGGQGVGEGGLPGGVGSLDGQDHAVTHHRILEQGGECGPASQPNTSRQPGGQHRLTFGPGHQWPSPARTAGDQGGGQGVPQVKHGDLLPGSTSPVLHPAAVQGGHRGAAQLGLGHVQPQIAADVDQAPRLAPVSTCPVS